MSCLLYTSMSLVGVPVVGGIADIASATSRYMIQEVLLAMPNPSPEVIANVCLLYTSRCV